MSDALANQPSRVISGIGTQAANTFFQAAGTLLLHPVIVLPILIYLLGGTPAQIAWYAVITGIGNGIGAPVGSVVASRPELTRLIAGILLAIQSIGFLLLTFTALRADALANASLLQLSASGFLLLILPTGILLRIVDQSREYARAAIGTVAITVIGVAGVVLAAFGTWRLLDTDVSGPDDLLGRILLPGSLSLLCATWLGMMPILASDHFPYPARPLPGIHRPGFFSNAPLMRYSAFHLLDGLSRFADPFILVAVLSHLTPQIQWIGGAVLAFAIGEAIARMVMALSRRQPNPRSAIVAGVFLRAAALIIIAFLPTIADASLLAERESSEAWQNWILVVAALALGAGYWTTHTGNASYVQSITPPSTRELTRALVGGVLTVVAFAPIIAVQMLESTSLEVLLRYGAGAAVIALLFSPIIVRPYSQPRKRRGAWSLRL